MKIPAGLDVNQLLSLVQAKEADRNKSGVQKSGFDQMTNGKAGGGDMDIGKMLGGLLQKVLGGLMGGGGGGFDLSKILGMIPGASGIMGALQGIGGMMSKQGGG